jgi:hypothetical protein
MGLFKPSRAVRKSMDEWDHRRNAANRKAAADRIRKAERERIARDRKSRGGR